MTGLWARKGTLPHFDTIGDSETALTKLVVAEFGLDLSRNDRRDIDILHREGLSQVTESDEGVLALARNEMGDNDVFIEEQRRLFEVKIT